MLITESMSCKSILRLSILLIGIDAIDFDGSEGIDRVGVSLRGFGCPLALTYILLANLVAIHVRQDGVVWVFR